MTKLMRVLRNGAVVWGCLCASSSAVAAEPEPVRVEFRATPGCGDSAGFLAAVRARTPRVRAATADEPARTFRVDIVRADEGTLRGEFSVSESEHPEQASAPRTIEAESCREVFDALALFAALSVDPDALTEPSSLAASTPAPVSTPAPSSTPAPLSTPAPPPVASARPPAGRSGSRPHAGVGCGLGTIAVGAQSMASFVEPFAQASYGRLGERGVSLAPALRVGFSSFSVDTPNTLDGPAHLHWTTLRVDGCPVALQPTRSLIGRTCLTASGGALDASGLTIAHSTPQTHGFWTLGGVARLEWNVLAFVSIELSAGIEAPLRRDRFYFDPSTDAYRVPKALGRGSLGVSFAFL